MKTVLAAAVLGAALLSGAAFAAPIAGVGGAPDTASLNGNGADGSTGSLQVQFSTATQYKLEKLEWWGYYDDLSVQIDDFVVTLNNDIVGDQGATSGNPVGTFSARSVAAGDVQGSTLYLYSFTFASDFFLDAGSHTLDLINDGDGAALWFWQGAVNSVLYDDPAWTAAWTLHGEATQQQVPEPGSVALVLSALLAAAGASARRPRT